MTDKPLTLKDTGQDRAPAGLESELINLPACNLIPPDLPPETEPPVNQVKSIGNGQGLTRFFVERGAPPTVPTPPQCT